MVRAGRSDLDNLTHLLHCERPDLFLRDTSVGRHGRSKPGLPVLTESAQSVEDRAVNAQAGVRLISRSWEAGLRLCSRKVRRSQPCSIGTWGGSGLPPGVADDDRPSPPALHRAGGRSEKVPRSRPTRRAIPPRSPGEPSVRMPPQRGAGLISTRKDGLHVPDAATQLTPAARPERHESAPWLAEPWGARRSRRRSTGHSRRNGLPRHVQEAPALLRRERTARHGAVAYSAAER
jgi:hypothetical protein